jgi:hypothetical protein
MTVSKSISKGYRYAGGQENLYQQNYRSGTMSARLTGGVTLTAEYRTPDFWVEWNLVVLSAIVANNIKPFVSVVSNSRFFGTAFGAALRRHHVALVKHILFFFSEQKDLLALHTRDLNIRHR